MWISGQGGGCWRDGGHSAAVALMRRPGGHRIGRPEDMVYGHLTPALAEFLIGSESVGRLGKRRPENFVSIDRKTFN
jgi:hypothetical protein